MVQFLRRYPALNATALFAILWAIARAAVQTITGDESDTYVLYVARECCTHWMPSANNHVLNTMLMRLTTGIFGASELTVRLPALIGAAIYIGAAHKLVRWLTDEVRLQWILFACLVLNPFVFDYLVAARGYGLASAFLLSAITVVFTGASAVRSAAWMSALLALAFAANFSFAVVCTVIFVLLGAWLVRRNGFTPPLLAALFGPGLLVTLLVTSWTLATWPRDQLTDGVETMREFLRSVLQSSLYEVNPLLVNPLLMHTFVRAGRLAVLALGILAAARAAFLLRRRSEADRQIPLLAAFAAAAALLSIVGHWLLLQLFHVLLPHDRTALWVAVLLTLVAAALAALPAVHRIEVWIRRGQVTALAVLAIYFVSCLRLNYFREWEWGSEAKQAYWVLAYYNHTQCVRDVQSSWLYIGTLNFYRTISGRESFDFFNSADPYPKDRSLYVLHSELDRKFLEQEKLAIVYRGERTKLVVAVRPELLAARSCAVTASR